MKGMSVRFGHSHPRLAGHYEMNMQAIVAAGIPYTMGNFNTPTVRFREKDGPPVDFYPNTGRWRIVGGPRRGTTHVGTAEGFLAWYRRQRRAGEPPRN